MKIICWGARGSIPVSGKEYVKYGGDTTCVEVRSANNDIIIVDAGTGIRKLGNKLLAANERACSILFTHAHWDHLLGFPFFKLIYMKGSKINLYGRSSEGQTIQDILAKSMVAPYFPIDFKMLGAEFTTHEVGEEAFDIGSLRITPIPLSHPNQGIGYKFTEDKKSFVFLTDNELTLKHAGGRDYEDYLRFVTGADLLIHDAEYTEEQYKFTRGWGHSVYTDALRLAREGKVKRFGLFHHNQERSDKDVDRIVADCRRIVKEEHAKLRCFAAQAGKEIVL